MERSQHFWPPLHIRTVTSRRPTLDPFSPPNWSLSLRPHTNTLTCPSGVGSTVVAGFLLSALLRLAASSSSSNARKEKLAAISSSSALARAVRLIPWILQSIPLLLHCRMPISKKRYSCNVTKVGKSGPVCCIWNFWVEESLAYSSYLRRANFSYISLQNIANFYVGTKSQLVQRAGHPFSTKGSPSKMGQPLCL